MLVLIKFRKEREAWGLGSLTQSKNISENHIGVWSMAFDNRINYMKERTSPNEKLVNMLKLSYIVLILVYDTILPLERRVLFFLITYSVCFIHY